MLIVFQDFVIGRTYCTLKCDNIRRWLALSIPVGCATHEHPSNYLSSISKCFLICYYRSTNLLKTHSKFRQDLRMVMAVRTDVYIWKWVDSHVMCFPHIYVPVCYSCCLSRKLVTILCSSREVGCTVQIIGKDLYMRKSADIHGVIDKIQFLFWKTTFGTHSC